MKMLTVKFTNASAEAVGFALKSKERQLISELEKTSDETWSTVIRRQLADNRAAYAALDSAAVSIETNPA